MECVYDFFEVVNCANTLNHVAIIEYGENGLQFDRVHNKVESVWATLHPLQEGESIVNLNNNIYLVD